MLKNFIIIAWRNMLRNRTYAAINIFGLSLGLASAIIILLSIENELSFDRFYPKQDNLYMVWNRDKIDGKIWCWATTAVPLAPGLKEKYPEVVASTRVTYSNTSLIKYKEKALRAIGNAIDPEFLTMFQFPMLKGDPNSAMNGLNNIVITESFAKKIFGNEDPVGKEITFDNKTTLIVSGLMKDLPNNTRFNFEYLINFSLMTKLSPFFGGWGNNCLQTFVELKPGTNVAALDNKIKGIVKANENDVSSEVFLHSLSRLHLYSDFVNGVSVGGRITYVRMIGVIAAFILIIACINFMNLSTARSEKRAREVGVRKVVGATRQQLILQFLGESILLAFLSFCVSLVLVQLLLPLFNDLVGKQLVMQFGNPLYWAAAVVIVLVTGLLAGCYPAFYLSSFQPVRVLKSDLSAPGRAVTPRKVMVVLQFVFSIGLIICTVIIQDQIQYARARPSGYDRAHLVDHFATGDLAKNFEPLRNELISSGIATDICRTNNKITEDGSNGWGLTWAGKEPGKNILFDQINTTGKFSSTFKLVLKEGRDLDLEQYPADTVCCMINESAAKVIGTKDPIGFLLNSDSINYKVVGVFKDFIWGSPYKPITPMIVYGDNFSELHGIINVRLNHNKPLADNIKAMEKVFKKYNPSFPFEYGFVDKNYDFKFKGEEVIGKLAGISALLAIIISCLGLFGLAAFTAEQRTKEIGVRRVLGASVSDIVRLLSKDFVLLVAIAALVAFPLSWWAMDGWLSNYSYRITISLLVFVWAGLGALVIAISTVSAQAIRAAKANPVKSLCSE